MTNVNGRSNHFEDHSRVSIAQKWINYFPIANTRPLTRNAPNGWLHCHRMIVLPADESGTR